LGLPHHREQRSRDEDNEKTWEFPWQFEPTARLGAEVMDLCEIVVQGRHNDATGGTEEESGQEGTFEVVQPHGAHSTPDLRISDGISLRDALCLCFFAVATSGWTLNFAGNPQFPYGGNVKSLKASVVIGILISVSTAMVTAQDKAAPKRLVFEGKNTTGEVWANVGLTRQRFAEDYLPMVVMVTNYSNEPVVFDRDSFRLIGNDGNRYPMPSLKELRKGYKRLGLDARAVSGTGIPWEVWARERRLAESNFFPNLSRNRRALVIDEVTLMSGYALIDVLYFAKPSGFAPGQPIILEVQAVGWETPIHLGMVLN